MRQLKIKNEEKGFEDSVIMKGNVRVVCGNHKS